MTFEISDRPYIQRWSHKIIVELGNPSNGADIAAAPCSRVCGDAGVTTPSLLPVI